MRVGIDYRAGLVNIEGIGRYARELVRAMCGLGFDGSLGLFGYTLARRRFSRAELGIAGSSAELLRLRLPARWTPWLLERLGKGVDDLVGGCAVYHHTQPNLLAVREAAEVVTIFDCIYTLDAGYMDRADAERTTAVAREQVARARRILVPSEYVGAEVVMALGAHPGRISVTHLGCDHAARDLPPGGFDPPPQPYVLTVARVDPRKNHERMLQAFEHLVREGFPHRWVIAGPSGWGCGGFERALADSPAKGRVEWRRAVDDRELTRLYAGADAFLFASLHEGFGLPPLEAMACGTPVVTSCVTSLPEICGDAALLVEPTDPDQIFEAARRILSEPDLAADLVRRGHIRARTMTWRECARRTLQAYRAAVEPEASEPELRRSL